MNRLDGILEFQPSTQVNIIEEPFTDRRYLPANQLLYFKAFFRVGDLITDMGNTLKALKYIDTSMDIMLLEPISGTQEARPLVAKHPHTILLDHLKIPHDEIIPAYNCHGLCFGDSVYRIPDVTQLLIDEYQECDEKEASCVIFYENRITVHSALIKDGKYIAKGGYRGLFQSSSIQGAISNDIKFDRYTFYRKNKAQS